MSPARRPAFSARLPFSTERTRTPLPFFTPKNSPSWGVMFSTIRPLRAEEVTTTMLIEGMSTSAISTPRYELVPLSSLENTQGCAGGSTDQFWAACEKVRSNGNNTALVKTYLRMFSPPTAFFGLTPTDRRTAVFVLPNGWHV